MKACGGAAFPRHLGVERLFRDAGAGWVMAPTVDQRSDFIGREARPCRRRWRRHLFGHHFPIPPLPPATGGSYRGLLPPIRSGRRTFLDLLRYIERYAPDEPTAELSRRARLDEARHVHFGLPTRNTSLARPNSLRPPRSRRPPPRRDSLQRRRRPGADSGLPDHPGCRRRRPFLRSPRPPSLPRVSWKPCTTSASSAFSPAASPPSRPRPSPTSTPQILCSDTQWPASGPARQAAS